MDKGEAKLEALVTFEPKSPDEIIKLLNINLKEWKLSSYWNKQVQEGWRISALVTKIKESDEGKLFEQLLSKWNPKKHYIDSKPKVNKKRQTLGDYLFYCLENG